MRNCMLITVWLDDCKVCDGQVSDCYDLDSLRDVADGWVGRNNWNRISTNDILPREKDHDNYRNPAVS
jgi:hypothetical protein